MKVLSLFSGVGGFDLGLERAGMQTVFQCEWDKHATKILERHWPDVPRWDDVSTLTGAHVLQHAPVIDVVAWGSPCQDLSVAGKRAGLGGERSGLFHQGIRIIKEIRELTNGQYPRISIWENVAGALSSSNGADFGEVLYEMDEAGACFSEWRMLDAQYFGVPQRRRRVFVVSVFDSATAARCPDPLLPVSESMRRDTETSGTPRQEPAGTVEESIGSSSEVAGTLTWRMKNGYNGQDAMSNLLQVVDTNHARPVGSAVLGSEIVGALNAVDYKWPQNQQLEENKCIPVETFTEEALAFDGYNQTVGNVSQTIRADKSDGDHVGMVLQTFTKAKRAQSTTDDETWVEGKPAPTLNAFDQGDTRATTVIAFENSYRDAARIAEGPVNTLSAKMGTGGNNTPMVAVPDRPVAYSIREDAKANTFSATELDRSNALSALRPSPQSHHAQMFITEPTMAVRRLTPIECERLMGWPDGWTDGQADTHRYKQCGNGVASPVATWIGQQLINL